MSTELDPDVIRYITEYPCNRSGTAWVHYTIANKVMLELVKSGYADFLFLKNDEVREWWEAHQEADRKAQEEKAEKRRIAKLKKEALAKLSDEEKKVLGIKK